MKSIKKALKNRALNSLSCLLAAALVINTCAANTDAGIIPINSDMLKEYDAQTKEIIQEELDEFKTRAFKNRKSENAPLYLGTAGAPGAGKSTLLENLIHSLEEKNTKFSYIDPDRAVMMHMHCYINSISLLGRASCSQSYSETVKNAYTFWRTASNYIANSAFNEAANKKLNIAHGTTASAPAIKFLYQKLKQKGYKIQLVLCYSTPKLRKIALEHRIKTQAQYQVTPEDAITKAEAFVQNLPLYLENGDEISLYWWNNLKTPHVKAAEIAGKKLKILDKKAYEAFVKQYKKDCKHYTEESKGQKKYPAWQELLQNAKVEVEKK